MKLIPSTNRIFPISAIFTKKPPQASLLTHLSSFTHSPFSLAHIELEIASFGVDFLNQSPNSTMMERRWRRMTLKEIQPLTSLITSLLIPLLRGMKEAIQGKRFGCLSCKSCSCHESFMKYFGMQKSSLFMEKFSMFLSFLEEGYERGNFLFSSYSSRIRK